MTKATKRSSRKRMKSRGNKRVKSNTRVLKRHFLRMKLHG